MVSAYYHTVQNESGSGAEGHERGTSWQHRVDDFFGVVEWCWRSEPLVGCSLFAVVSPPTTSALEGQSKKAPPATSQLE